VKTIGGGGPKYDLGLLHVAGPGFQEKIHYGLKIPSALKGKGVWVWKWTKVLLGFGVVISETSYGPEIKQGRGNGTSPVNRKFKRWTDTRGSNRGGIPHAFLEVKGRAYSLAGELGRSWHLPEKG